MKDRFVTVVTTRSATWNIGLAIILVIAIHHLLKRGWSRAMGFRIPP